ncbi:DUF4167 domain-containing protein [Bartonella sp. A05]|uniref:DUF4167 domain-containing protein n=1 Tax=Bartonella sp. A05 TaxID=2967261 RepID=UPI0022A93FAF|nr:DUF4167 domain-containing protein [Bartonella sp. A05]MCZ2203729.1 DUF4167 domain-containing protein [Bartonella sp. A05]
MRPQQNRRVRGRNNNNNRRGPNPLSRNYESNGPDVKIRGNAQQIADKYISLARDAQGSGDRVMAENYLQHAEHYLRIILAAIGQMPQHAQRDENSEQECGEISAAEDIKRSDVSADNSALQMQSQKNSNEPKGQEKNGQACNPLDVNALSAESDPQEQCAVGDVSETVKRPRRVSRRRVTQPQEAPSLELSQEMKELTGEKDEATETKKVVALLSEGVQKKPRRRRMVASLAEENV